MTRFGGLDILVSNAGIFIGKGIEESTADDWERLCAVNLPGVILGTQAALPAPRARAAASLQGGAIVNLSSIAGVVGLPLAPLYSLTKGGITMFTKSLALEFARKGYRSRVNSIHPGIIDDEMGRQAIASRARITGADDVEAARGGDGRRLSPRPARHGERRRQEHHLSGLRRCELHDRRVARRRRRLDGAVGCASHPLMLRALWSGSS